MEILIATNNQDKIREITRVFQLPGVNLHTLADFPDFPAVEEDGNTLTENALKKARMLADYTGFATIADDTGLEVAALGGLPGVRSSRYAGEKATYAQNVAQLIRTMRDIPVSARQARFRCIAVFYHPTLTLIEEGQIEGMILDEPRGTGGFGYDPVFLIPSLGKTFAELDLRTKNSISHRGQAFSRLAQKLERHLNAFNFKD